MTTNLRPDGRGGLEWPPLVSGRLIRRYKRFLADVLLDDGRTVAAHCPNSGAMRACCEPGRPVYLSRHDDPRRKLAYTWELIEMPGSLVGVNTQVPNKLTAEAIRAGEIDSLSGYEDIRAEVKTGENTRLDLMLRGEGRPDAYVEVKNCTLVEEGVAFFPDAVTVRGRKHLVELMRLKQEGFRSVLFFLVQRMDARLFRPADEIDPAYGREFRRAQAAGVEMLVYDVSLDLRRIAVNRQLPFTSIPNQSSL
jgi:sugar fermentation stimulation protein A